MCSEKCCYLCKYLAFIDSSAISDYMCTRNFTKCSFNPSVFSCEHYCEEAEE
ncbi:MAG: hypothetical protein N2489_07510 [Clostridia bacterium]|nr:hypothetical protein [Clostridia bacterium]